MRRAGEQSPLGEAAELGNVPTPTAASGTSASSLPLLGLKQTPAAAAPQVLPKDAHPARAIFLLLWGCLSVLRIVRQVGLPPLMLREGLMLDEDLMLGEGLMLG